MCAAAAEVARDALKRTFGMFKNIRDDVSEVESDPAVAPTRPVRLRRAKKSVTRPRKKRRTAVAHAGIHLRAHKRMSW
jgi:hypothetical protein